MFMFQKLTWFKIVRSHNCEINAEIREKKGKSMLSLCPRVCDAFFIFANCLKFSCTFLRAAFTQGEILFEFSFPRAVQN